MATRRYSDEVERGIGYLDITYDKWWESVDMSKLLMWSPVTHVLAQIRHELYYETPEFCARAWGWQEEHGFQVCGQSADWIELNVTWMLRINTIRFERATDARK